METHQLKAFVTIAEELNFRRAAEILHMSQPPLTRLIARLEIELSTKLFERTTREVRLTSAGVYLLREAREILARIDQAQSEVRTIGKLRSGKIAVGFSTTSFLARLPKILEEFTSRSPSIKIDLHQASRQKIVGKLKDGTLDVGFIEGITHETDLTCEQVRDEQLGVLLPKNHRLARRKRIEFSELDQETIILHPRKEHREYFDTIKSLFDQNGISPNIYIRSEEESCPILVSLGRGILITIAGSKNRSPKETTFVPIANLRLPVSMCWKSANISPGIKSFLSFASEEAILGEQRIECLADVMHT